MYVRQPVGRLIKKKLNYHLVFTEWASVDLNPHAGIFSFPSISPFFSPPPFFCLLLGGKGGNKGKKMSTYESWTRDVYGSQLTNVHLLGWEIHGAVSAAHS